MQSFNFSIFCVCLYIIISLHFFGKNKQIPLFLKLLVFYHCLRNIKQFIIFTYVQFRGIGATVAIE